MPGSSRLITCPDPRCGKTNRIPVPPREGGEYRCGECNTILLITAHKQDGEPRPASFVASGWTAPQSAPLRRGKPGRTSDVAPVWLVLPAVVSMLFLLLAVFGKWPYGFYTILRAVVCGTAVYLAYQAYERASRFWPWVMGGIALLFNPIIVVRLRRADWQIVDFLAAVVFGIWVAHCALRLVRPRAG